MPSAYPLPYIYVIRIDKSVKWFSGCLLVGHSIGSDSKVQSPVELTSHKDYCRNRVG